MASFSNQSKTASTFANGAFGSGGRTWGDIDFTWGEAQGTWANPFGYGNQAKTATSFSNETKN